MRDVGPQYNLGGLRIKPPIKFSIVEIGIALYGNLPCIVTICLIKGMMVGSFRIAMAKLVGGATSRIETSCGYR